MMRFKVISLLIAAGLVADARAGSDCWNIRLDFSGVQGDQNWSYGYRESGGPFVLMPEYTPPVSWNVHYSGPPPIYWTHITLLGNVALMHPNGLITSGGREPVDHEAVLRWTSPLAGSVTVATTAGKENTARGNGVDWIVRHNGAVLQNSFIAFNDAIGVSYETTLQVAVGDTIDFALNSHLSNDLADTTHFTAIIRVPQLGPDINRDCQVNVNDLLAVITGWGPCPDACTTPCPADVDENCAVDVNDLLAVITNWD